MTLKEIATLSKTKTFRFSIISILTGIGLIYLGEKPEGVALINGAILAICLRDGVRKNGGKSK